MRTSSRPSRVTRISFAGGLVRTNFPGFYGSGSRGQLYQPWQIFPTYWSYDAVEGNTEIYRGWDLQASWDHLGLTGVIGHPFLIGNLLIMASDQSRTGVATYDISDITNPVLLDVLQTGGPGGYWPELWGGDGKLLIVFPYRTNGNGFRVVDVTDPTDLRFVTDQSLPGDECQYVQFQDEFAFLGSHKVDMRTYQSVLFLDGANTVRTSDGGVGVNTSQHLLPLGNLLVTGGIGPNEGMAIWAHQAEPDLRGPSVSYHIPRAGQTGYPLTAPISLLIHETLETATISNGSSFIVRPLGGQPISGDLFFSFNDTLTFTPSSNLMADTTYEVIVPGGGIEDVAGNGIEAYAFSFSTGSTNQGNQPPAINLFTATPYPVAPSGVVSFTVSATDPESGPLQYRYDFGDGSPKTAWGSATSTQTAYAAAGHYQAKVQCADTSGVIVTRAVLVTVITPPTNPPPSHSSQVICDEAGRRVFTVNPDNDSISGFDADTLTPLFETAVGADPRSVALSGAGQLWVTCHDADRIDLLNPVTG
ncbi:MAG: Ig-like domain-containing protein, partial [Verrucomicrobiota bacterium]